MSITIKDIAEKTSLANMTVSQILRGEGTVRPETRKRVLEMAKKLGYHPNNAARAMRSGRFNAVALLLGYRQGWMEIPINVTDELSSCFSGRSMNLVMHRKSVEEIIESGLKSGILKEIMVDGVIIACWDRLAKLRSNIVEEPSVPSVWLNVDFKKNCVFSDDFEAGRIVTETLLRMGHRRIAYVDYSATPHYSSADRMRGYESAMKSAGLPPRTIRKSTEHLKRIDSAYGLLSGSDRPTAVVAYSPETALPLIFCACSRLSLNVPQDLSVISFESYVETIMGVGLSSIIFPEREIGAEAGKMLLARIDQPGVSMPSVCVPFKNIEGGTCATPPQIKLSGKVRVRG